MTYSPQFQRALEVLADGEWHPYREVVSKMAAAVHPGVAVRRAEANRSGAARRKGYATVDAREKERVATELARIGALAIARQTLSCNTRHFEIAPRGVLTRHVERQVRLRKVGGEHEPAQHPGVRPSQG